MAAAAALHEGGDIAGAQADGVVEALAHMLYEAAKVAEMEAGVERGDLSVAGAARDFAVAGGVPAVIVLADFVAACAGFAGVVLVIETAGGHDANGDCRRC